MDVRYILVADVLDKYGEDVAASYPLVFDDRDAGVRVFENTNAFPACLSLTRPRVTGGGRGGGVDLAARPRLSPRMQPSSTRREPRASSGASRWRRCR